jgi:hypothetical protein
MPKQTLIAKTEYPLRWPKGWNRTAIEARKTKKAWKKTFSQYVGELTIQMAKIGVSDLIITFNDGERAVRDPGVTIYFWKPLSADFSWQLGLGIDNPAPTLAEIDDAFQEKAMKYHPDRLGDKATADDIEKYKKLGEYRKQAKAWVLGTHRTDRPYSLPCDRFTEPRWNLKALIFGIASLRRLDEYGLPGLLERASQPELLEAGNDNAA